MLTQTQINNIETFVSQMFKKTQQNIKDKKTLFVLSRVLKPVTFNIGYCDGVFVVGSGYLNSSMVMYGLYKTDNRFFATKNKRKAKDFLIKKVTSHIEHVTKVQKKYQKFIENS